MTSKFDVDFGGIGESLLSDLSEIVRGPETPLYQNLSNI